MSFPNQTSMHGTIQQLKEIVTGLKGEDHEAARLVDQMEELVVEIERKSKVPSRAPASSMTAVAIKPPQVQATV